MFYVPGWSKFANSESFLREAAGKRPAVFTADGLPDYNDAFRKEFWTRRGPRPKHAREIRLQNQRANSNIRERLNGEFHDREKVFLGLKKDDSLPSPGKSYYNFFRPHMSLDGKTPADMAGIDIKGNNKWKTVIENARSRQLTRGKPIRLPLT